MVTEQQKLHMSKQLYSQCLLKASVIVQQYHSDIEAYNFVATTTALIAVAAVSATSALASAGVGVYGAYRQAESQKQMSDWNSKVAQNSAFSAHQQGEAEANLVRTRGLKLMGAQQAAAGRSGVTLGGSVDSVMYDSSLQNELDQMSSLYRGELTSDRDLNQSISDQYSGSQAQANAPFQAAGSILTGVGAAGQSVAGYYASSSRLNNPEPEY